MDIDLNGISWDDRIALILGNLYEGYGYRRYRMGKFEPYDLYSGNKSFLKSESVITFTDSRGRLLALRPDVTMSIAKHVPSDGISKLYYVENVFRKAPGSDDFGEIRQIGLEYIGDSGFFSETEALLLAQRSLEQISAGHILSIGHMGLVSDLLDGSGVSGETREAILDAVRKKNPSAVRALSSGMQERHLKQLELLAELSAPAVKALPILRERLDADIAGRYIDELYEVCCALDDLGRGDRLYIDFSILNDMDYYNGLIFAGYIEGVPRAVLSGGRYDNLMRKFGSGLQAVGFAVYLGELTRAFSDRREYDADAVLVTGGADARAAVAAAEKLRGEGLHVCACGEVPADFRAKRVIKLGPDGKTEETDA